MESAYATTDSKDGGQSRGRSKGRHRMDKKTTRDWHEKEVEQQGWIRVDKNSKLKHKSDHYYIELSNAYSN